jgi:hypothetical protein
MAIAPGGKPGIELNIILSLGNFLGLFFEKIQRSVTASRQQT